MDYKIYAQLGDVIRREGGEQAEFVRRDGLQVDLDRRYIIADRILLGALDLLYDFWEALEVCKEGKTRIEGYRPYQQRFEAFKSKWNKKQKDLRQSGLPMPEITKRLVRGDALFRPYPFMPPQHLCRSESLVSYLQGEFWKRTDGRCTLNFSTIPGAKSSDILGVIATKDIGIGTVLYNESAIFAASSADPVGEHHANSGENKVYCEMCCDRIDPLRKETPSCNDCPAKHCTDYCKVAGQGTYHQVLCGKDFGWIYSVDKHGKSCQADKVNKDIAAESALWLRVLAFCVQKDCHPLDNPFMARLTSQYEGKIPREWSVSRNLDRLHRILERLGIDIFQDHRYDKWVLQTIWGRIINNQLGKVYPDGRVTRSIGSLWCFYNHSCEPNVQFHPMATAAGDEARVGSLVVRTEKPIKKGQEICISYVDFAGQDRHSRQMLLRGWLPGSCRCTKCERGD